METASLMQRQYVKSLDGTALYVEECGDQNAPAILFIHGTSHSHLVWQKQMQSHLAEKYRLVCYDLRGHGLSDKPASGYEKGENWADDVQQIIETLHLNRPILVGWSFGGLVISDYVRKYGESEIAGFNFVNASTRLGVPGRENDISGAYKALMSGLNSKELAAGMEALAGFVQLCVYKKHDLAEFYTFLGMNAMVAPKARSGILQRVVSNDDILCEIKKPVLLTHGANDQIVLPCVAERHATLIPHAKTSYYEETGHCAFWEKPTRFNEELDRFMQSIQG